MGEIGGLLKGILADGADFHVFHGCMRQLLGIVERGQTVEAVVGDLSDSDMGLARVGVGLLGKMLAALKQLPKTAAQLRKKLPARSQPTLAQLEGRVRKGLAPKEAYNMVPGRDPGNA